MINEVFEGLKSKSLVDWGVVLLGISGELPSTEKERLAGQYVSEYASEELARVNPEDELFDVLTLLVLDGDPWLPETKMYVESACRAFTADLELSLHKWRAGIIASLVGDIDPNPLYGTLQLTEIWANWGGGRKMRLRPCAMEREVFRWISTARWSNLSVSKATLKNG